MTTDKLTAIFGLSVGLVVCVLQVRTERDIAMIVLGATIVAAIQLLSSGKEE